MSVSVHVRKHACMCMSVCACVCIYVCLCIHSCVTRHCVCVHTYTHTQEEQEVKHGDCAVRATAQVLCDQDGPMGTKMALWGPMETLWGPGWLYGGTTPASPLHSCSERLTF